MKLWLAMLLFFTKMVVLGQQSAILTITVTDKVTGQPMPYATVILTFTGRPDKGMTGSDVVRKVLLHQEGIGDSFRYEIQAAGFRTQKGEYNIGKNYSANVLPVSLEPVPTLPKPLPSPTQLTITPKRASPKGPFQVQGNVRDYFGVGVTEVEVKAVGRKKIRQALTNQAGDFTLTIPSSDINDNRIQLEFFKKGYKPEQRTLNSTDLDFSQGVFLEQLPQSPVEFDVMKRIKGQVITTYKPRKLTENVVVQLKTPRDSQFVYTNENGEFLFERSSKTFIPKDTINLKFSQFDFNSVEKRLPYEFMEQPVYIKLSRKAYFDNLSPNDLSLSMGYAASILNINSDNLLNNPFFRVSFDHFVSQRLSAGISFSYASLAYQVPRNTQVSPENNAQVSFYPISRPQRNFMLQARAHLRPYNTIRWNYLIGVAQSLFDWNNSQIFIGARQPLISKLLAFDVQLIYANHRHVSVPLLRQSAQQRGTFNYWGNDTGNRTDPGNFPTETFHSFYLCASLHVMLPGL